MEWIAFFVVLGILGALSDMWDDHSRREKQLQDELSDLRQKLNTHRRS